MYNMPKCKSCEFYEKTTVNFSNGKQVSHACNSPKWCWTDEDKEERFAKNSLTMTNSAEFDIKHNVVPFIIKRHCQYEKSLMYIKEIEKLDINKPGFPHVLVRKKLDEVINVVNLLVERENN